MTVSTIISKSGPYAGAGTTGPFTVGFRFLENSHLRVIRTDAAGLDAELVLTADYTVAGAGASTGTVTLVTALASGQKLTILRNVPATQEADYVQNDAFPAESHEIALDKLTMLAQQNAESLGRALVLPPSVASGVSTQLPIPLANTVFGWDETGTALKNLDPQLLATIAAYGLSQPDVFTGDGVTTSWTLTYSPGGLGNLDVSVGGVTQIPGDDYQWMGGLAFTTTLPVPNGIKLLVRYAQALPGIESQFRTDLALSTGAALVGGAAQVVASITGLRALLKTSASKNAFATGYYAAGDGGGGPYWLDAADTSTADNGGTVIVAGDGGRWKLVHGGTISIRQFGAKGDGATNDYAAIQAAINSGIRRIYVPSGRFKCLSTLNLCNLAATGVPLKLFGDATAYDNGTLTAGSVILSNPGAGNWIAELVGSQFVTIEDLMFVATGANAASFGLLYARSMVAGFAQNNSLRRVIVKVDAGGGTIALGNNCAEQFVADECWFEADIPYVTTLANEQGFVSQYSTIANTIFSNTAQSFRLSTFQPLTSTGMILTGLGTANFDNCVVIPKAGNTYAYGVTLRSSLQAYQDCQNITFTGQIESWVNAVRLEGNTRDVKFDFSTSSVTGAHILAVAGTTHYSPKVATNPFNTTGVNVMAATGPTVTVYGGSITMAPNLTLVDANLKLLGTDVDGGNANLASGAVFGLNALSSFNPRWSSSRTSSSTAWNPGTVTAGTSVFTIFAVAGVALGDRVEMVWPYASLGCMAAASVESAGNVRITINNLSGFNQTFLAGTWRVLIERLTA